MNKKVLGFIFAGVIVLLIVFGVLRLLFGISIFSIFDNTNEAQRNVITTHDDLGRALNDVPMVTPDTALGDNQEQGYVIRDFEITLDAILGRTSGQAGYVIGMQTVGTGTIFNDDAIAEKISTAIRYEIIDVQVEDAAAVVTVFISAPDMSVILTNAASRLATEGNDDVDELMAQVDLALNAEYDVFETTVNVGLQQIGENWFLVPDFSFSNAISGNLLWLYSQMVDEMFNELMEGGQ